MQPSEKSSQERKNSRWPKIPLKWGSTVFLYNLEKTIISSYISYFNSLMGKSYDRIYWRLIIMRNTDFLFLCTKCRKNKFFEWQHPFSKLMTNENLIWFKTFLNPKLRGFEVHDVPCSRPSHPISSRIAARWHISHRCKQNKKSSA